MFKPVNPQVDFPKLEQEILEKWEKQQTVEKYLARNDNSEKTFSFLDGPITANNPMGVHHAWGRTYKDLWQRFWNMRGKKQRFQNGFDCQGLWVEVEVEKELNIRNKKDIENLVPGNKKESIAKFVELCKERVLKYSAIQTKQSKRLAYFMDWDNSYFTMSDKNNYMIWHFLKTCHEKGWIYKGKDTVPWCPRCETAISQHEMLTEDYKELTHESILIKFHINTKGWEKTSLLVWTTTPWTIPANVAVAVNPKFKYGVWENKDTKERIIFIAKDEEGKEPKRLLKNKVITLEEFIFSKEKSFNKLKEISGKDLVGLTYLGPFDNLTIVKKAKEEKEETFHSVVSAEDIVVSEEGTGLLHVAPGAGKEDFEISKKEGLAVISPITEDASYVDGMDDFSGKNAKKHPELIVDYLREYERGKFFFSSFPYTHRYPACWRCKTELVWRTTEEWYIAMDRKDDQSKTLREQMIETAMKITWLPKFGLDAELNWLSNMSDWLISKKNRYWGLALPIFECRKCGHFEVIGSREELKEKTKRGWEEFEEHSPHKPFVDEVKIECGKCGELVSRIEDVGNVWLDAGIVPFSTIGSKKEELSYLSDKEKWQEWFPADFITESFPGQFKNWFYSLIAMSTVLEKTNPFKTVLGFASVLGEDGRPMHKSWGNAIEFNEGAEKIGVDVMRWVFLTQNPEQNLLFGFKKTDETRRKFHLILWNVYNFFITYANADRWDVKEKEKSAENILDRWIKSRINETVKQVTMHLEKYEAQKGAFEIEEFVNDLSLWYVRRSRDRVGPSAGDRKDKDSFYSTLYDVLVTLAKIMAPFNPFIAEEIYTNLTDKESVHLSDWPEFEENMIDKKLEEEMRQARQLVEIAHAQRKENSVKVRQPLALFETVTKDELVDEVLDVIGKEINVKRVINKKGGTVSGKLYLSITPELKEEGEARDIVRQIQVERKNIGVKPEELVDVELDKWPKKFEEYIKTKAQVGSMKKGQKFTVVRHE